MDLAPSFSLGAEGLADNLLFCSHPCSFFNTEEQHDNVEGCLV